MAELFDLDEAIDYINWRCAQAHPASAPPTSMVQINCAGTVTRLDLSALPPGTLINSRVTGEFFKVDHDHWVTTGTPLIQYADADVATQVDLGWDGYLQESDFHLIHVGD